MDVRHRFESSNNPSPAEPADADTTDAQGYSRLVDCKNIRVYICTWNVNTKQPGFDVSKLLAFDKEDEAEPEICAIGLQEVNAKPLQRIYDYFYNNPWTAALTEHLSKYDYVRLQSTRLVGIVLNVFVKRSLLPYVRCSTTDWIRLGFCGFWGNKGANFCGLSVGQEHSKIMYHTFNLAGKPEVTTEQDYLFMFGDLNFRVEKVPIERVKELVNRRDFATLLDNDQLKKCIKEEKCFSDFREAPINFAPSYKFDVNTDVYDTSSKRRVPSWCDRVLYKLSTQRHADLLDCIPLVYSSIPLLTISDHKPVYALFSILSKDLGGKWIEFVQVAPDTKQNLEITYRVNRGCAPTHPNDWIGVYDPTFGSHEEYLTYAWAAVLSEKELTEISSTRQSRTPLCASSRAAAAGNTSAEAAGAAVGGTERGEAAEASASATTGPTTNVQTAVDYIEKRVTVKQRCIRHGVLVLGYYSAVARQLISLSSSFEICIS